MIVQLDDIPPAIIQSLVFGGLIFLIFITIAVLLLRRNRNRFSISLAMYFLSVAVGLAINFTYRLLGVFGTLEFPTHTVIYSVLQICVIYFTTLAGIYLLHFNLALYFSTKIFSKKRQIYITIIYAIILLGMFVIGLVQLPNADGVYEYGVTWDESENPVWSLYMGAYFLIISQLVFLFIIYYAVKISKKMGKNKYSKKYLRNILGILFFDVQLIGAFLAFTYGLRDVGLYIQLVAILPGAFLLASGLKKEPET